MNSSELNVFDETESLHHLKHYLPSQAPLKDFVHHNTLHAFQHSSFHEAIQQASQNFGFKTYLNLDEFRAKYNAGQIREEIIDLILARHISASEQEMWKNRMLLESFDFRFTSKIGMIRNMWKDRYKINLDKQVHPTLFRIVGSYLDQGISIWRFPSGQKGFLTAIRELEKNSAKSLFATKKVRELLLHSRLELRTLLQLLVGNEECFERYLFDQQFAHPGWSGMISVIEDQPESLLDRRAIRLHEFIAFELLLELDAIYHHLGENWKPLCFELNIHPAPLPEPAVSNDYFKVLELWQEAFEWTYYDEVLAGLQYGAIHAKAPSSPSFQSIFCIDDRECSIRRHIEALDPRSKTYGSAGFFNVEFFFQPEHGKFYTKVCPAPLTPKYLLKESEAVLRHKKDPHFNDHTYGVIGGWLISQTVGLWSAFKLTKSIFYPTESPKMVSSFKHMDPNGKIQIVLNAKHAQFKELQLGYKMGEMVDRMEGLLKSIGMVDSFARLVYIVGHGASSINNTHYAGYDCGACCGRPGSANARVAAWMLNNDEVRLGLRERGIDIPESTKFVGALHDTTRDEIAFYDVEVLDKEALNEHLRNKLVMDNALAFNAKERARRFELINTHKSAAEVHKRVKLRSLSLFEPRPEWNHATNALCVVGRRDSFKNVFLDRRAFLNSYDYKVDASGDYLTGILKAVAPVCGGINLEYYFSRVDNYRLGAGSKLPHNVVGLIGVANGMDGDLRPGLPKQMINIHDPLRLLVIVEDEPSKVLDVIKRVDATYEWFKNEWVRLAVIHPSTKDIYVFLNEEFKLYAPLHQAGLEAHNFEHIIEENRNNLPVYILNNHGK